MPPSKINQEMHLIEECIRTHLSASEKGFWFVDENIDVNFFAHQHPQNHTYQALDLITNRYDLYTTLQKAGWNITFNDFMIKQTMHNQYSKTFYRISKEKAITHHIINQCFRILKPGGSLYLFGSKDEGIKTYHKKTSELFRNGNFQKNSCLSLGQYSKEYRQDDSLNWLDDQNYQEFTLLDTQIQQPKALPTTKPGLFGWSKIDTGSTLLVEELLSYRQEVENASILDLGCGYGLLAIAASEFSPKKVVATDNNAAAINACEINFEQFNIPGSVVASHCGDTIKETFDWVLCNPPFHSGFSTNQDLTDLFLKNASALLNPNGQALFVVNQFIPLEKKAAAYFSTIKKCNNKQGFCVFHLTKEWS